MDINLFACRRQKLKLAFEIVVSEEKFSFVMKVSEVASLVHIQPIDLRHAQKEDFSTCWDFV